MKSLLQETIGLIGEPNLWQWCYQLLILLSSHAVASLVISVTVLVLVYLLPAPAYDQLVPAYTYIFPTRSAKFNQTTSTPSSSISRQRDTDTQLVFTHPPGTPQALKPQEHPTKFVKMKPSSNSAALSTASTSNALGYRPSTARPSQQKPQEEEKPKPSDTITTEQTATAVPQLTTDSRIQLQTLTDPPPLEGPMSALNEWQTETKQRRPCSCCIEGGLTYNTVEFRWSKGGERVYLVGSFTNWETNIPMTRVLSPTDESAVCHMVTLLLPQGHHEYRFIVDGDWRADWSKQTIQTQLPDRNNLIHVRDMMECQTAEEATKERPSCDSCIKGGLPYKTVEFRWSKGGESVYLVGSFTNWNTRIPMTRVLSPADEGVVCHMVTLLLPHGHHEYKFTVDGIWCVDRSAQTIRTPLGEQNNLIHVCD